MDLLMTGIHHFFLGAVIIMLPVAIGVTLAAFLSGDCDCIPKKYHRRDPEVDTKDSPYLKDDE